jgi:hypothetical protein
VQGLFRVRAGLNGVNPVVIRGRVVWVFLEDACENREIFFVARARKRIGKKNSRLRILGIALDELAVQSNFLRLLRAFLVFFLSGLLGGFGCSARFDNQSLRFAGVVL